MSAYILTEKVNQPIKGLSSVGSSNIIPVFNTSYFKNEPDDVI